MATSTDARLTQSPDDRWRLAFELSLDLLCTTDGARFLDLNPAWERWLGWKLKDLRAKPARAVIHPYDWAATQNELARVLEDPSATGYFECRLKHKDGRWLPWAWVARSRDGVIYATARDLSDARRAEDALAESQTRLWTIIDTAVDAIVTVDKWGHITHANPAVERVFGWAASTLLGESVSVLLPVAGHDHGDAASLFVETARTGVVGLNVTGLRQDGSTFPAELTASDFDLDGGQYFTGIIRDVSERRQLERMQSEFVSTVSHELRTPLTSIRGSLGLVAHGVCGELPEMAAEYINIALLNAERLVRLINDILDMEKIQSGRMEFRMAALDLSASVRAAIDANQSYAVEHQVTIALQGEPAAGTVLADEDRLAQVLANLMSNAAKFSPAGATVDVSIERRAGNLRVSVEDHGSGIPEEFRSRIFGRFAQADASSSRQKGGTGLGLSICKAIVEKMQGWIGFDSVTGEGSCFFFELPLLPAEASTAGHQAGVQHVLVCEDDSVCARILLNIVANAGFATDHAPTLERARALLAERTYAAVTLDLGLPDGDGTTLISHIRANPAWANLPILVVSGLRPHETRAHLGPAVLSVADIIEKPFDDLRLKTALRAAAARSRVAAPRVLHVEDNRDLRRVVRRMLPESWTFVEAGSLAVARDHLAESTFDVVLLDLTLPDGGGEQLIDEVGSAQVIIFSATETSAALGARVSAALVKSRATERHLRDVLLKLIAHPDAPDATPVGDAVLEEAS